MIKKISTPLGEMIAYANPDGLCLLKFFDCANLTELISQTSEINHYQGQYQPKIVLNQTQTQITEYFNQKRKIFTLPIICYGSPFQLTAWKILKKIPYGTTISYQDQAMALNKFSNRAAAIYLLYALYFKQPARPLVSNILHFNNDMYTCIIPKNLTHL